MAGHRPEPLVDEEEHSDERAAGGGLRCATRSDGEQAQGDAVGWNPVHWAASRHRAAGEGRTGQQETYCPSHVVVRGSVTRKRAPPLGDSVTDIVPSRAARCSLTKASPSPVPVF